MTTAALEQDYQTIIGLEVHAQVLTSSKMYCNCSAAYANAEPNTHVCPVCLGLPGALPVINRAAVETVLRTGLALECTVPEFCKLDRKNYVYPDLPKGYQISQYDLPLCIDGTISFEVDGKTITAGITRVHIEEDTGRLLHEDSAAESVTLVDLNRSGVPLMEIVGEPDLRSPSQAREYLIALRRILRYIGASTGSMEDGAYRCDANVSIRAVDGSFRGPKVEVKNMNSFRAVERALRFEAQRQRQVVAAGGDLVQETRGWSEARGATTSQRSKEQAHDYRYFPEPDLPPLHTTSDILDGLRDTLPESPATRRQRFILQFGLSAHDSALLTSERTLADTFEEATATVSDAADYQTTSNWIVNDIMGLARSRNLPFDQLPVSSSQIAELVKLVKSGTLTGRSAKDLLPLLEPEELPSQAAQRLNLLSLDDSASILPAVHEVLERNPAAVADFRSGKGAAIGRLIGEVMRRTSGRAKPDVVRATILEVLKADPETG